MAKRKHVCNLGELMPGSDHKWITLNINTQREKIIQTNLNKEFPSWAFQKINLDIFEAIVAAESWTAQYQRTKSAEEMVREMIDTLVRASNAAMSRKRDIVRKRLLLSRLFFWTLAMFQCPHF